jgi:hypothetical protein
MGEDVAFHIDAIKSITLAGWMDGNYFFNCLVLIEVFEFSYKAQLLRAYLLHY